jgi:hypothetical protein
MNIPEDLSILGLLARGIFFWMKLSWEPDCPKHARILP